MSKDKIAKDTREAMQRIGATEYMIQTAQLCAMDAYDKALESVRTNLMSNEQIVSIVCNRCPNRTLNCVRDKCYTVSACRSTWLHAIMHTLKNVIVEFGTSEAPTAKEKKSDCRP